MSNCLRPSISFNFKRHRIIIFVSLISIARMLLSACASIISSATGNMANDLTHAILDNDDLKTVETGAPAYLLMIDGLIYGDPDNSELLRTAPLCINGVRS